MSKDDDVSVMKVGAPMIRLVCKNSVSGTKRWKHGFPGYLIWVKGVIATCKKQYGSERGAEAGERELSLDRVGSHRRVVFIIDRATDARQVPERLRAREVRKKDQAALNLGGLD